MQKSTWILVSVNSFCHKPACAKVQRQRRMVTEHSNEGLRSLMFHFLCFLAASWPRRVLHLVGWLKPSVMWGLRPWLFCLYCITSVFPLTRSIGPRIVKRYPINLLSSRPRESQHPMSSCHLVGTETLSSAFGLSCMKSSNWPWNSLSFSGKRSKTVFLGQRISPLSIKTTKPFDPKSWKGK